MEKIHAINKIQKYLILFVAGVLLTIATTFIQIPFLGIAISILTFVTYIFLWMSYATARKYALKSKGKYLLLAILITVTTIAIMGATMLISGQLSMAMLASGLDITTMTPEQLVELGQRLMPAYMQYMLIIQGVSTVLNVIFVGLAWMIRNDNTLDLQEATQEYEASFQ